MFSTDPTRTSPVPRGSGSIHPATSPRLPRAGRHRIAADSVLGGLTLPLIGFAVADLINPDWSPIEAMTSHYVHAPRGGWLIPSGVLILAVASAALTRLLAAHTRGGRVGLALLGVWAAALVVVGVFPTDPPGHWERPMTTAGVLHGVAGLLAFATLPAAAVVLSRVWRRDPRWRPVAGALAVMAAVSVARCRSARRDGDGDGDAGRRPGRGGLDLAGHRPLRPRCHDRTHWLGARHRRGHPGVRRQLGVGGARIQPSFGRRPRR